jgi:mRNA-degrading endonuclease toxin of MazEF toxin-antitoxin module
MRPDGHDPEDTKRGTPPKGTVLKMATPDRGDILELRWTTKENKRQEAFVLVLSPVGFNCFGSAFVCPVIMENGTERSHGFAVRFGPTGKGNGGLVLCHRLRTLRYDALTSRNVGRLTAEFVNEVLARVHTLI